MTRHICYICELSKKGKFFPKSQPYPTHKICDKCIAKNLRRNATMIDMITKRTKIIPTKEEQLAIELSFTTVRELNELSKENPKSANIIKDLSDCTDKDIIRSSLKKLALSNSSTEELIMHFYTVASINKRARERHDDQQKQPSDQQNQSKKSSELSLESLHDAVDTSEVTVAQSAENAQLVDELLSRAKKE